MSDDLVETRIPRRMLRSWRLSRRATAKAMVGVGLAGIAASVLGLIVGEILIGQVQSSVDQSLKLTNDALVAVDDSITVTASMVKTVRNGIDSVKTTIETVQTALDNSSTAITDSSTFIGSSLPDALDAVNQVLPTIESVASSIDSALELLSRAPFGPDYNPVKPFDQSIADLSTALDPLPKQLRTLSTDFDSVTKSTTSISTGLDTLTTDVADLETQLDDVSKLLDRYTSTTAGAQALASASRHDLSQSAALSRGLLVLLAVVFAIGQIVPIWLGLALLRRDDPLVDGSPPADAGG